MTERFSIVEVQDARFLAGELFETVFGGALPGFPRHFVCLYRAGPGEYRTAGYVHFSRFESVYLAGGLVVDKKIYAQIPKEHLAELQANGSIGEFVMREGIARLTDSVAVFAFIGDARSIAVNRNVGYVPTHVDNLYGYWQRDFSPQEKRAIAERVARVAPF